MKQEKKVTGDEYFFEIAVFLATSARGCMDEPPLYGPFRLIDGLSRLIDLPKYTPCLSDDAFLKRMKAEIDEKKFLVMFDQEGFRKFLDELVYQFSKELKERTLK